MNILIVDDLAANRKLLRAQLEGEGFSVVEAADGVEAMQVLAREPLDAVISDILMPRMDGYRLCHEVRKNSAFERLRFVLYSSTYTSPADVRLSGTVGADQFVAKPATIAAILVALQVPTRGGSSRPPFSPDEAIVLEQYSSVLVAKLEEKNTDLQRALEVSRRAHDRIEELNIDLERRVGERTAELAATNRELSTALADVKQLTGLLPICSYCKRIRDGKDYWDSVEGYITRHTDSSFSHGVCPTCHEKHVVPQLKELGIDMPSSPLAMHAHGPRLSHQQTCGLPPRRVL
ncbi:MAG: response regulator [Opitutaceae bacterium]